MNKFQDAVSDAVRAYLGAVGLSQKVLAAELHLTQPALSRKLSGSRKWLPCDLDALAELGVELPAPGKRIAPMVATLPGLAVAQ